MFSFGSTAASTGNSLFPSTANAATQNPQPQSTGFQFGAGLTPSTNNTSSIGAGTTGTSGMFKFGSSSNNAPTSNSFNFGGSSTAPSNLFGSNFNNPAFNSFNSPATVSSSGPLVASLSTHPFQYLQQCYDPNNSNYRFRAFFYNVATDLTEAQRIERQTQKPNNVSDALWAQTQNDNPDPKNMIPVLANGFGDLHSRARWEDESIRAHTEKLNELHEKSSKLLRDLDIDLTAKLISAQQRHQSLSLRLLKIMKGMEILRRNGTKLSASESQALTKLKASLSKLSSGSLENGALYNLNFQLESLLEAGRLDAFRSARVIKPANDESSAALQTLLQDQQENLKTLVESVQKDSSDLQIIKGGYRPL